MPPRSRPQAAGQRCSSDKHAGTVAALQEGLSQEGRETLLVFHGPVGWKGIYQVLKPTKQCDSTVQWVNRAQKKPK